MTTSHFGELLDLHGLGEDRKRNCSFCLVHLYNSPTRWDSRLA